MTRAPRPRLLLTVALLLAVAVPASATGAPGGASARPSNFQVLVNGKVLSAAELNAAADTYMPRKAGRSMTVSVRWTTDLKGTGHRVVVTDALTKLKRTCTAGTSCSLTSPKVLAVGQEMSYGILIYRGTKVVSDKVVCLIGIR